MSAARLSPTETRIAEIQEKLESANHFIREINVPSEIAPVFMTGRLELLPLAVPRALTAEECKALYDVIGGLLETNAALREHAALVADLARQITGGLGGVLAAAQRMRSFASFDEPRDEEGGEG